MILNPRWHLECIPHNNPVDWKFDETKVKTVSRVTCRKCGRFIGYHDSAARISKRKVNTDTQTVESEEDLLQTGEQ